MLFLLNRIAPYLVPLLFFTLVKLLFYFPDQWVIIIVAVIVLALSNFILLKFKDKTKPVFWLALWSLVYALSGSAYILILEHTWIINTFLILWSLVYWLYLEAVFHDFYETEKTYILDLQNITLYGNILIIFFLTAALDSLYVFLNFSWLQIFPLLALVYYCLLNLAYLRQKLPGREIRIYSLMGAWILFGLATAVSFLPSSIYVLASVVSLAYYILVTLLLLDYKGKLPAKSLWKHLLFFGLVMLVVLATAAWF